MRRVAILAAVGLVFGPILDCAHVRVGAIGYPGEVAFVPWWVPFVYMGATLGIGLSHPALDRALGRPDRSISPGRLTFGFVGLFAVWIGSGAIPLRGPPLDAVLAAAAIGLFFALDGTWQGFVLAVATAVAGCAAEIALVWAGAFYHTRRDVLGIASWLPWVYVAGSVAVGNLGRVLARGKASLAGEAAPV